MRIKLRARLPQLELKIVNEREMIEEVTTVLAAGIKARTEAGQGALGALPLPKSGDHAALSATGRLVNSIQGVVQEKTKDGETRWRGVVKPTGARPAEENVREKKFAAERKTKQLRAAVVVVTALGRWAGSSKSEGKVRLGRLRVRTAETNASLAGILSTEPKDPRGISGHRGLYRVFALRDSEVAGASKIVQDRIKPELEQVGETVIESK